MLVESSSVLSRSVQPLEQDHQDALTPPPECVASSQPAPLSNSRSTPRSNRSNKIGLGQEVQIFFSTFLTIFLAELGDKTQLTTLLMSAESHSPWVVFVGAGAALVATSLLGVLLGHWLSKRVSAKTLETAAAAMLLLIAVLLLWDVVQG